MHNETKTRYCLQCDDGTALQYGTQAVHGEVLGEPYTVDNVTGWHCPACGDIEYTAHDDSAMRMSAAIDAAGERASTREPVELHLSPEVMAAFKATGPGWQARIDDALKDWLRTHSPA